VGAALHALGPQPPNFRSIVELNRGPLETETTELLPLTPRQVEQRRAEGALLVDVRTDFQFDEAHIEDSVCITALHGGFGTKLAWLATPDRRSSSSGATTTTPTWPPASPPRSACERSAATSPAG